MHDFDLSAILSNPEYRTMLITGIRTTIEIAVLSWVLGMALALVLHELATNAVKYGALSVPEGHVVVLWGTTDIEGAARLQFRQWRRRSDRARRGRRFSAR